MNNNNAPPPAMPQRTDKNFGSTNPYADPPPQQYGNAAAPAAYPGLQPAPTGMYLDPGPGNAQPYAGAPPPQYPPPGAQYPPPQYGQPQPQAYPGLAPPPQQAPPPLYPGLQPPGKVESVPQVQVIVTQQHTVVPVQMQEGIPGTVTCNFYRSSSFGALQPLHLLLNGRRTPGMMAYESFRVFNVPPGRLVIRATHGSAGDLIVDAAPNQVLYFDCYTQMAGLGAHHHIKLKDEGWFFQNTKGNRTGKDFNSLSGDKHADKAAKKADKKAKKAEKKAAKHGK